MKNTTEMAGRVAELLGSTSKKPSIASVAALRRKELSLAFFGTFARKI